MAQGQSLRISQTQRLALTPGLRQSISILGMSTIELAEHIATEIADNPLLLHTDPAPTAGGDFQFALETVARPQTLADILNSQISTSRSPEAVREIAFYLAADLTDRGYLADDETTIAKTLGVEFSLVRAAVTLLQSFEPAGIAARNLTECLELQLRARDIPDGYRKLLVNNLSRFAQRDWQYLARISGLSYAKLEQLSEILRSLTPRPADSATTPPPENLRPDVQVRQDTAGHFVVELINSVAPSLRVDTALAEKIHTGDSHAHDYLREKSDRANALIRAIEARSKTVLRVTQAIVRHQSGFFLNDHATLKPLTRHALAQTLGLHPSTVTRAVANKSLNCQRGVFPLRFFFSRSLEYPAGDDNISVYAVQLEIWQLVGRESAEHVLSDNEIATILRESGVDIARRTVAKYRQCLNIPSSVQRRKAKKFLCAPAFAASAREPATLAGRSGFGQNSSDKIPT